MDRAEIMWKRVEKNLEMGRKMWKRVEKLRKPGQKRCGNGQN